MTKYDLSYSQNRELSWLEFNIRVLNEAHDPGVPDLEKLTFVSIFVSNLDEFFMVRVGSLNDLSKIKEQPIDNKSGMTNREQLDAIFKKMPELYERKDKAYFEVEDQLRGHGIVNLSYGELSDEEKIEVDNYFDNYLMPIISPLTVDSRHPFPNFQNNSPYIICEIDYGGEDIIGIVPAKLAEKDFYILEGPGLRYILKEEIIKGNLDRIFQTKTKNPAVISVTRSADLDLEEGLDEFDDDIRKHMRKSLKKRQRLEPVRLEIQSHISDQALEYLQDNLNLSDEQVFYSKSPIMMDYAFDLFDHLDRIDSSVAREISKTPFSPQLSSSIDPNRSIIEQIEEEDKLLFYPYESMDSFLDLLKESASDPDVISIKITIYRLANMSKVGEYLANAAENGKEVIVLMELKARFDEDHNILWSERLEEAGCTVIYGFEGYKVHSKICLISRHRNGEIEYISQFGTGNYNEKTSKQYTDLSLITADKDFGIDAQKFFNNMMIGKLDGEYDRLLVAPHSLKAGLIDLIDKEIEKAENNKEGKIWIKCNSVTERDIIDKLAQASQAGVEIFMNVRGICCIVPGVQGKTDNIKVTSIVGRFLEHPRIYIFGAEDPAMYISSADLMTRNLQRRVEIAAPLLAKNTREKLMRIVEIYTKDDRKARILQPDGSYTRDISDDPMAAQSKFMEIALENARIAEEERKKESKNDKGRPIQESNNESLNQALDKRVSDMGFWERLKFLFFG